MCKSYYYTRVICLLLFVTLSSSLTISPRYVRLIKFPAEAELDKNYPKPYEFGYSVKDGFGTKQHRKEVANSDGVVTGTYGYLDPAGVYRFVDYIADRSGYRAKLRAIKLGASSEVKDNVIENSSSNIDSSESLSPKGNELFAPNINTSDVLKGLVPQNY
ncbi:hypothetical protein CDAR_6571 [Caerostris darwini]|uniref:Uncharacterized protein n=1 Tax=Caerostris darwini TaxID=1538125 RepID=A0AAV4MP96_9ARAC|nr:hypothetical protein CDAR_6571 [Caerostris darwini]